MKKIIFATGNQDKMREIREILADMDVEVVSMKEAGLQDLLMQSMRLIRSMQEILVWILIL